MNDMTRVSVVSSATAEPVTLMELKSHLRVSTSTSYTAENTYLNGLIGAARTYVEDVTWRKLMRQTWDMYLDQFPSTNEIRLPFGKLQAVTSVTYVNSTGATTTFSTGNYSVDTKSRIGRVVLNSSALWPSDILSPTNPITVRFRCGYGSSSSATPAAKVPFALKQAIKIMAADFYENREYNIVARWVTKVPRGFDALVASYRLKSF